MGGGSWDDDDYLKQRKQRKQSGQDDFSYDADLKSRSTDEWKANPDLDPRNIKDVRESRDSDEHPLSRAVAVFFDVTGSMGGIPRVFQTKLGKLIDLLKKSGIKDPHVMLAAVGDTKCDRVPLQIGQFESDNRIDEQLRLFFLEGGGGGQVYESYGLAHYVAGWKTAIDCWEKRQEKGYLFTIGDEMPWSPLTKKEIQSVFGDNLEKSITMEEAIAKASEKYHVFHLNVTDGSHGRDPEVVKKWRSLLGERVLMLDDPSAVCELIVSTIALIEGTANPDDLATSLGLDKKTAKTVSDALSDYVDSAKTDGDTDTKDTKKKTGRIF